jgi:hypothetical protein
METSKKKKTSTLKSVRNVEINTGLRCFSVGPSATNPQKERVADYKTRAITLSLSDAAEVSAHLAMITASKDAKANPDAKIVITAHCDKHNDDGYALTVLLREDGVDVESE